MKKKMLIFGVVLSVSVAAYLKAKARPMVVLAHYCIVQNTSPGHSTIDCGGDAAACNAKADCVSN